jgi:prephenate dehydrogenase
MKIAIIGLGHIGFWLASELSADNQVAAFDSNPGKTKGTSAFTTLERLADVRDFAPELLINAVSLQHTLNAFKQVLPYVGKGCIISDVASVKGRIADYYHTVPFSFASVHPMFGPTHAKMGRLSEENGVVISESCEVGRLFFEELFARLEIRTFHYSFDEHDRMMAYSLTTPFVASLVFAACVNAQAVPGTNFSRHMALAKNLLSEDDDLLSEILFNPHSIAELNGITSRLEFLKHIIGARDGEEAHRFFDGLRRNLTRKNEAEKFTW